MMGKKEEEAGLHRVRKGLAATSIIWEQVVGICLKNMQGSLLS